EADPQRVDAALGCARVALRKGQLDLARHWLRHARGLQPDSGRLARLHEALLRHLEASRRERHDRQRRPRAF
ncbi:MAG: hypothetical protein KDD82_28755, partial [Planctomycetes bacterium]|nr:hypothetical protein [Planctomycetota bacterium]